VKILFSATPAHGHVLPLLPLARALRSRGHDIAFLTSAGLAPLLQEEEFGMVPAGPMPDVLIEEVHRRIGLDAPTNPTAESVVAFFVDTRLDLGADEAVTGARAWQPDLVVAEVCDYVGPLVAAELGVRWASVAFGPSLPPELTGPMATRARERYAERDVDAVDPAWIVDPCPPSLQVDGWAAPPNRIAIRPEAHRVPGRETPGYSPGGRPRVLVTFGTHFTEPAVLDPILGELSALGVNLTVTLGFVAKPDDFPSAGSQVEFVSFTPLAELLPNVDAVLTHGGAGTTLGALAYGVPLVVVPQGADQFLQAARVAAARAGIAFGSDPVTPAAVANAVRAVLADPEIQGNARMIASEIAALPSPETVAADLEKKLRDNG
jgi:UDP:flavonoid glycosyltransferase YjiC (YdhE family)